LHTGEEYGSDEGNECTPHAGVPARNGSAGQRWAEYGGDGKDLHVAEQTLNNRGKADLKGWLNAAGSKPVSPDRMDITRLRAELARVRLGRDILRKRHPRNSTAWARCAIASS
jgi:hypothetical protein